MGLNMSWIAMRATKAEMLARLGFTDTDERQDDWWDGPCAAQFTNGWAVHANGRGYKEKWLRDLQGEFVAFEMSETVMECQAAGYRDGARLWRVTHDPELDGDGLEVEGDPPAAYAALAAGLRQRQADEEEDNVDHMFDIACELSGAICGWRPDKDDEEHVFTRTQAPPKVRREKPGGSWLARLFGR